MVDAVAAAFQRGSALVMAERLLMRGETIETCVDSVATLVETVFDPLATRVQAVVDAITAVVQALLHAFATVGGHRHAGRQQQHRARERNGQGTAPPDAPQVPEVSSCTPLVDGHWSSCTKSRKQPHAK